MGVGFDCGIDGGLGYRGPSQRLHQRIVYSQALYTCVYSLDPFAGSMTPRRRPGRSKVPNDASRLDLDFRPTAR